MLRFAPISSNPNTESTHKPSETLKALHTPVQKAPKQKPFLEFSSNNTPIKDVSTEYDDSINGASLTFNHPRVVVNVSREDMEAILAFRANHNVFAATESFSANKNWLYMRKEAEGFLGPFSTQEMQAVFESGEMDRETIIRRSGEVETFMLERLVQRYYKKTRAEARRAEGKLSGPVCLQNLDPCSFLMMDDAEEARMRLQTRPRAERDNVEKPELGVLRGIIDLGEDTEDEEEFEGTRSRAETVLMR